LEKVGNATFKALFNSWKKLDQLQDGVIAIPSDKPVKSGAAFTSAFGVRADPFRGGAAMHPGIDLSGARGTPIYVAADGKVTRCQLIGRMGSTGRSTGNHLHYEVRIDGRAVNPIPFMKSTDYVLAMQRRANAPAMESLAIGGPPEGAKR
jgi:murein DD-endopeptidase MepM/ murein hydrolase activator NlpD